jgi:hypothetical protein
MCTIPPLFCLMPPPTILTITTSFPFCYSRRRAIEEAFESAKKKFQEGEPTEDMVDALRWLESTTDWTRLRRSDGSVPIPPREIQSELTFTFDWCARLLEQTPEMVREVGLPSSRLYHENPTVGGLAAVYENWASQRSAWLRKQESESNPAVEVPLPATFAPEPLCALGCD